MNLQPLKILTFLFCIHLNSYAQDEFKEQFNYAQNLYEQENYFDTITELKRLLFFNKNKEYSYHANLLIGKAFKEGAKLNEAAYHFTLAEINSKNGEEFYESRTELIRVNILRRTTFQALKLLRELEADKRFTNKINDITYWRGWVYIFDDDWEKASAEFDKISADHRLKILCEEINDKMYSEELAKLLSVFIPGAGQIYTGHYLNGLMSLSWNILAGYLSLNAFVEERVFDGLITANLLWLRFYLGGIWNAENFAENENRKISNDALNYLQNEFSGLKP